MIRLFTALAPSDSITERLQFVQKDLNGFRWLNPSTYHCTLVYFGDTNVYLYRQIKQQLHNIYFSPFTVEFKGVEVFPNQKNEPHVLVVKATSEPRLTDLQAEMNKTIGMFHPNLLMKNRFSPHITLARLTNPDPNALQNILTEFNNFTFGSVEVNRFALYSSRPTSFGSVYTKLESYQFNAVNQPMPV